MRNVQPFTDVDDENILPDRVIPQSLIRVSEMAVPSHILTLRRIAGEIFEQVYAHPRHGLDSAEKEALLSTLHGKLLHWRRTMPFPLRESSVSPVPHLTTLWYDMNFYCHLITLYRPSPLCPILNLEKVHFLANTAALAIRKTSEMHRHVKLAFNWLNLFTLFTAILTLIYSISAQPDPLPGFLERSGALMDLDLAIDLLEEFGRKLPSSLKCRDMIVDVRQLLQRQVDHQHHRESSSQQQQQQPLSPSTSSPSITKSQDTDPLSGTSYPFSAMWNQQYDVLLSRVNRETSSPPAQHPSSQGFANDFDHVLQEDRPKFQTREDRNDLDYWHFDTPLQRIFLSEDMGAHVSRQYDMDAGDTFMGFEGM